MAHATSSPALPLPTSVDPPADPTWRDRAACATADADLFFPRPGQRADKAKAICRRCPVRAECLQEALSRPPCDDEAGIRGAMTETERRRIRSKLAPGRRTSNMPVHSR